MADDDNNPAVARDRLLALLDDCEWRFSERAIREGKLVMRRLHQREPTEWEMVEYVISLLKTDATLRCAPQGDPPGSTGIAWQLTDPNNIFVKLRIEGPIGREFAYIQSFHESVHPK